MENKIVKWEEGDWLLLSISLGEFEDIVQRLPLGVKHTPEVHDTITSDRRYGNPFFITKIEGEDIFGYYIKGDSDEK